MEFVVAEEFDGDLLAFFGPEEGSELAEGVGVGGLVVDFEEDVAGVDAGLVGGGVGNNRGDCLAGGARTAIPLMSYGSGRSKSFPGFKNKREWGKSSVTR